MNDSHVYNFTLEVDEPNRIDKLLSNYFIEYSRATVQKWIINKDVLIDGKTCTQKDKIKSNCNVSINVKTKPEINLIPENIDIEIIDETNDYIIVNKSSGMVTHIAPGNYTGTLQNALYYKYPELSNVPRTGIIHRLDKNTSGILVVSRNLSSHNNLVQQLQNKKFIKIYHALVSGFIDKPIVINEPIGRHSVNRKKMAISINGKDALSKIKLLNRLNKSSHIEVQIITGRTHQIRVHLSHINNPVIGDKLYGFRKNIFNKDNDILANIDMKFEQYLHARSLSFIDPATQKVKKYTADYPKEYIGLLEKLHEKN